MRLIDADALLNALGIGEGGDCEKCNYNACGIFCGRGKDFVDCCKAICDAPTIGECKRGRWKRRIVDSGFNADWVCSECKYRVKTDFVNYNFCPHCGADMRQGGQDE